MSLRPTQFVFLNLLLVVLLLSACNTVTNAPEALAPTAFTVDPADVLYAQSGPNVIYVGSSAYSTQPEYSDQIADDFTVPAGYIWEVTQVFLPQAAGGPSDAGFNVFIYKDANGLPGDEVARFLGITNYQEELGFPSKFLIVLPQTVTLLEGRYWLSVQGNETATRSGSFAWAISATSQPLGNAVAVLNSSTCSTWKTYANCYPSQTEYDAVFSLLGSSAEVAPPTLTIFGNGSLHRKTGVATVTGTTTCETPGSWTVRVEVRQQQRKAPVEGFATSVVTCSGSSTVLWSAPVVPTNGGNFQSGLADVAVETLNANPSNRTLLTVNLR